MNGEMIETTNEEMNGDMRRATNEE